MSGTGCSCPCLVLRSGAPARQAWWWQNQQLLVSKGFYFCFTYEAVWLHMKFWVESSFLLLCWILASSLFWTVRFLLRDPSTMSLMGFPLWVTRLFSMAALRIFSFISTLVNLMIRCLGVALLHEYLCGVLCISWTWMVAFLARLGKFSWIISWRVFSSLDSFSPSHSGTSIKCILGLFT